jgi:hypothetical protein
MSEDPGREKDAAQTEREMREHEREARERSESEGDGPLDEDLGTPDSDAMPAPPGPAQGGSLGGAS